MRVEPPRRAAPARATRRGACAALLVLLAVSCSREDPARRTLRDATALYSEGKYAEAEPLLQKTRDAGLKDGTLLYELGFCREAVEKKPEERKTIWNEAQIVLEQEIAAPGGATLERLYELAVIHSDRQEWDRVKQYARQAVEQFEKGPNPNALTGEDWFRLGRLHDLVVETSEAEAAYRRSASDFAKSNQGSAIYRSLALAKVAELDVKMARFPQAAQEFDDALKLFPGNRQVPPFLHALTLFAAGRFDDAIAKFGADTGANNTESQYGLDLARKAKEVAPLDEKDQDGAPIHTLPDEVLEQRIQEAAKEFRAARDKNSYRPGDPLPAEVAVHQKRFVALLGENFARTKTLQDFCIHGGFADLVRR